MSNRSDWVDYAKAIGILLVVYGHVSRGLFNSGLQFDENLYFLIDSVIYSFHMPLFFFLSGLFFCGSFSKYGGRKLVCNKIDTILYPYLLWSILQGGIEAFLSSYTSGDVAFSDVFSLWLPRAQFWFLYALFMIFIVCSVIYSLVSEKLSLWVFAFSIVLYFWKPIFLDLAVLGFVYENLFFFMFGVIVTQYNVYSVLSRWSSCLVLFIVFVIAQYYFHGYAQKVYSEKGAETLLLACLSIVFIVSLSSILSKRPNRWLALIGGASMAIYLMHILAGSGVRIILSEIFGVESTLMHVAIGFIMAIALPLCALKVIEYLRIPYVFQAPLSTWVTLFIDKLLVSYRGSK